MTSDPGQASVSRIVLPPLASPVDELWHLLLDMGDALTVPWTLVGGQMVLLHALEHGQVPVQFSQDGDVIADIRSDRQAMSAMVAWLVDAGLSLAGMSPDFLAHRYARPSQVASRPVVVDVLAPDGVGGRANLTTSPPGRTVSVPAGTQLLQRTETVRVVHEGRVGSVPRPKLLAAIIGKAAALTLPGNADRHYRDLALLLCLVPDPFELREELSTKDRRRLRIARGKLDDRHVAWSLAPAGLRDNGRTAFRVLVGEAVDA